MKPTGWLPKWLGLFAKILCGLLIVYILVYAVLSLNGQYAFTLSDLGRIEGFSWAPAGLYLKYPVTESEAKWDYYMICLFYPVWRVDETYFHPPKNGYITDDETQRWQKLRQLEDFAHLSRQLPPTVPTYIIVAVLGTPTRTNLLVNGSSRWEYDYQSTNGPAFGSLFFTRRGVFEGSSTNANAQTFDLN